MDERQFKDLISLGREDLRLEFKSAMRWSDALTKAKITKAALALSNVRDGGYIVIGITQSQKDEAIALTGVASDDARSYTEDAIKSYVNEYADPFVDLIVHRPVCGGMQFVVIYVREFAELPVICKKDGSEGIRRGVIYTRTRRMAESAPCPTQSELREILDLALEKAMRKQLGLQGRVYGSPIVTHPAVDPYAKERESFS